MKASPDDSDALLVREAQAGSRAAFDMLVLKYQRRVERLLARSVRDPADVADLCQETFLAAYRALPAFRGDSAFYTWLYRIAINAAQRHRARHRPVESLDDEEGTFGTGVTPSHDATPEAMLASRQLAEGISAAVDALAEDQRRALLLREVDGLTYEEIGDLLDCPPGTVRSRIFRAREALAVRLRPLLGGSGGAAVVSADDLPLNEALSALADGRATPADWALISAAWDRDPGLRERWVLWHAAGDGLRSAELPALHRDPDALLAALHAQMPAPVIEHPRRRDWFAPVAVAASFVVLAVGWVALRPPPAPGETFAAAPPVMPHAQALAGTSFVQAAGREQGLLVEPSPVGIDWALPASEPAASRPALPAQPR